MNRTLSTRDSRVRHLPIHLRVISALLAPIQLLSAWPTPLLAAAVNDPPQKNAAKATVLNNTGPVPEPALLEREAKRIEKLQQDALKAQPVRVVPPHPVVAVRPPGTLQFSSPPTDVEISQCRLFAEPLLALGATDPADNSALVEALRSYAKSRKSANDAPLTDYLEAHPQSPWRASLLLNLGRLQAGRGFFTRGAASLREAWALAKAGNSPAHQAIAGSTSNALADTMAKMGDVEELRKLFADDGTRMVEGSAANRLRRTRGVLTRLPQKDYNSECGVVALRSLYAVTRPGKALPELLQPQYDLSKAGMTPTPGGLSLHQLWALGDHVGMETQVARRAKSVPWITPAIIHWKRGHFTTVLEQKGNNYRIFDPLLGGDVWLGAAALDEECSGYALVNGGALPEGWEISKNEEANRITGAFPTVFDSGYIDQDDEEDECSTGNCCGMPVYDLKVFSASLRLRDTPLSYIPPVGPSFDFTATYNENDSHQPYFFDYSNLGPLWTARWISFAQSSVGLLPDTSLAGEVIIYQPGGTIRRYRPVLNGTLGYFAPGDHDVSVIMEANFYSRDIVTAVLRVHQDEPEVIENPDGTTTTGPLPPPYTIGQGPVTRRLQDGTVETYGQEGGWGYLISSIRHPATPLQPGTQQPQEDLMTRFVYDTHGRLTQIFHPGIATPTEIYHCSDNSSDYPAFLRVREVRDPAGRSAKFEYNIDGRLWRLTDAEGLQSEILYQSDIDGGSPDKVAILRTPYGDTTFTYTGSVSGVTRSIEATDPRGGKERVEFHPLPIGGLPAQEAQTPQGMTVENADLNTVNSYHWSKKAMAEGRTAYADAHIYHWVRDTDPPAGIGMIRPILHSEKKPLEGRIWYEYPGQTGSSVGRTGTGSKPIKVGRVLDDGSTQIHQYGYTAEGKVMLSIDPLSRKTENEFATGGIDLLKVKQWTGAGYEVLAEYKNYNAQHLPAESIDAAGQSTIYRYTAEGKVRRVIRPRNGKYEATEYVYGDGSLGHPANRVWKVLRSALPLNGPDDAIAPAQAAVTECAYDAAGNANKVIGPDGYTVEYLYDNLGRLRKTTYPDLTYEQTIYSRLDAEWQRDRAGRWTRILHNANRQAESVTDPAGRTTRFEYCPCGVLEAIIDTKGNPTTFFYDIQGRVTEKVYADNSMLQYRYEAKTSRLKRIIDAKHQVTRYEYFKDNTLASVVYENAQVPTPGIAYTYDPAYKRVNTMTDQFGVTQYAYYPVRAEGTASGGTAYLGAGRLWTEDGPLTGDTDKIVHTYDEFGRELNCNINGTGETRTFDALGRLETVVNPLCQSPDYPLTPAKFTYHYVGNTGRLDYVDFPNQQRVRFGYHPNAAPQGAGNGDWRLSSIRNLGLSSSAGADGPEISRFDYQYDKAGNITSWAMQGAASSSGAPVAIPALAPQFYEFGYDRADQLTDATLRSGSPGAPAGPLNAYSYGYDAAGNRISEQVDGRVTGTPEQDVNALNQIKSHSAGGRMTFTGTLSEPANVTVGSVVAYVDPQLRWRASVPVTAGVNHIGVQAIDGNNNTTNKTIEVTVPTQATESFGYDENGNLLSDAHRSFSWDAANRLVKITYGAASAGNSTEFVYNGKGQRVQIIEKTNGDVTADRRFLWCGMEMKEERSIFGVVKRFYFQGVWTDTPELLFYTRDHLGSVREVTDTQGRVRVRYAYDPYGRRTKIAGDKDADSGFTGHFFHQKSGLHLAFFRAYDPELGRWLSRDPLGEIDGANLHTYVNSNPIRNVDPDGLRTLNITFGADDSYNGNIWKDVERQLGCLRKVLARCCKKWGVACDVNVAGGVNNNVRPPRPPGGYPSKGPQIPDTTSQLNGAINVIFSGDLGGEERARGRAGKGSGIAMETKGSGCTLAHELGHHAGYNGGLMDGGAHDINRSGVMYYQDTGGTDPDKCYCEKVSALAQ